VSIARLPSVSKRRQPPERVFERVNGADRAR
jgi:hypothetical protein